MRKEGRGRREGGRESWRDGGRRRRVEGEGKGGGGGGGRRSILK